MDILAEAVWPKPILKVWFCKKTQTSKNLQIHSSVEFLDHRGGPGRARPMAMPWPWPWPWPWPRHRHGMAIAIAMTMAMAMATAMAMAWNTDKTDTEGFHEMPHNVPCTMYHGGLSPAWTQPLQLLVTPWLRVRLESSPDPHGAQNTEFA